MRIDFHGLFFFRTVEKTVAFFEDSRRFQRLFNLAVFSGFIWFYFVFSSPPCGNCALRRLCLRRNANDREWLVNIILRSIHDYS